MKSSKSELEKNKIKNINKNISSTESIKKIPISSKNHIKLVLSILGSLIIILVISIIVLIFCKRKDNKDNYKNVNSPIIAKNNYTNITFSSENDDDPIQINYKYKNLKK